MGRPPFSGYCHTCRRRRIKCDKLRPECERCLSSGHKCLGYEIPLRMQHFTAVAAASGAQLVRISDTTKVVLPPPTMTQELPLTAFREQMAFSHLISKYQWGPFWKSLLRTSLDGPAPPDAAKADYTGSLATALSFMGNRFNAPKMMAEGYELNGKVIRALQSALSTGSKQQIAQWAFTIMILSLYQQEINLPHYYGMTRVVEWCGPEYFQQEPMLTSLRQMRAMHACKCFARYEGSFFDRERWKTVPWLYQPKTSYDRLMDIFVSIPGLTVSIALPAEPLSNDEKAAANAGVLKMISELHDWRRAWENSNQHSISEVSIPLADYGIAIIWARDLLSQPLMPNTAEQAAELVIYNAAIIQLMNLQDILHTGNRFPPSLPSEIDMNMLKKRDKPLYMPEDIKYRWQPLMEGLRLMRLAPRMFAFAKSTAVLSVSPFSIIYNASLGTGGLGRVCLSTMTTPDEYERADRELAIFRLWKRTELPTV
ncbi:hypothetical protein LX36DRAFT_592313 [Colletotrichum falcatum]|nr:hypothetical protein LX36DRAFT_592313 [Colletotrichum falcatum]